MVQPKASISRKVRASADTEKIAPRSTAMMTAVDARRIPDDRASSAAACS